MKLAVASETLSGFFVETSAALRYHPINCTIYSGHWLGHLVEGGRWTIAIAFTILNRCLDNNDCHSQ